MSNRERACDAATKLRKCVAIWRREVHMKLRARGNRILAKAGVVFGSVGVDTGLAFNWRMGWSLDTTGGKGLITGCRRSSYYSQRCLEYTRHTLAHCTVQIRHSSMYLSFFSEANCHVSRNHWLSRDEADMAY